MDVYYAAFCPHRQAYVGFSHDAFDKDVIVEEFKKISMKAAENAINEDEDNPEDDDGDDVLVTTQSRNKADSESIALGKHYFVFIFQSCTNKRPNMCFISARYCVFKLSHQWIRRQLELLEPALAFYGFIVNAEAFDGASENRSCAMNRCTMTFNDLCGHWLLKTDCDNDTDECVEEDSVGILDDADLTESCENENEVVVKQHYEIDVLPWYLPIAFKHPSLDGVNIIVTGDGPHALKKMRNAMELSGKEDKKRDLTLNGLPVQLRMAYDIWKRTPDADPNLRAQIMLFPKLTREVFLLNSKSRMRTPLAARAQGNSVVKMILKYHDLNNKRASIDSYASFILHCSMTDKWFDILNAKTEKGCDVITSANHRHIYELLDYVNFLTQWKNQVEPYQFFPVTTYQD
eukprot:scaffold2741_cov56-Cyclotella_meneghiniana.AAC.1